MFFCLIAGVKIRRCAVRLYGGERKIRRARAADCILEGIFIINHFENLNAYLAGVLKPEPQ